MMINTLKAKIDNTQKNSKYRLNGEEMKRFLTQ